MMRTVADPRLNLVFVHLNVPHPPWIYSESKDTFSSDPETTYLGNLRLVDRTIHDLRQELEAAGTWDNSTILLAADHPLRLAEWTKQALGGKPWTPHSEVPFLLKMAGQKQGVAYDRPMQEVVTKDLLLAILNREVTTPQQVAAWLDQHPPSQ
jgi:arylsulfatase A-like enzyme